LSIVQGLLKEYGYAALVVVLLLDSSGVPWPTEATLVVAGVAARNGHFSFAFAVLASAFGSALGSSLSYYLGRRMGPTLMRRIAYFFRLTPEHLDKVDAWFKRYGDKAAFFGRFIPFVRNFTGFPSGVGGVDFRKYLLYSVAGYTLYILFALSLGYLGSSLARVIQEFEFLLWIVIPIGLLFVWFRWGRKWHKKLWGKG